MGWEVLITRVSRRIKGLYEPDLALRAIYGISGV